MSQFLYLINKKLSIPESVINEVNSYQPTLDDFATGDVYQDMLQGLLFGEDDAVQIINEHEISADWRIFGNVRLFEGIGYSGARYMIVLNLMGEKVGYARTVHAMRNIFEIKKQMEAQELTYLYRTVAVTDSKESAVSASDKM